MIRWSLKIKLKEWFSFVFCYSSVTMLHFARTACFTQSKMMLKGIFIFEFDWSISKKYQMRHSRVYQVVVFMLGNAFFHYNKWGNFRSRQVQHIENSTDIASVDVVRRVENTTTFFKIISFPVARILSNVGTPSEWLFLALGLFKHMLVYFNVVRHVVT